MSQWAILLPQSLSEKQQWCESQHYFILRPVHNSAEFLWYLCFHVNCNVPDTTNLSTNSVSHSELWRQWVSVWSSMKAWFIYHNSTSEWRISPNFRLLDDQHFIWRQTPITSVSFLTRLFWDPVINCPSPDGKCRNVSFWRQILLYFTQKCSIIPTQVSPQWWTHPLLISRAHNFAGSWLPIIIVSTEIMKIQVIHENLMNSFSWKYVSDFIPSFQLTWWSSWRTWERRVLMNNTSRVCYTPNESFMNICSIQ